MDDKVYRDQQEQVEALYAALGRFAVEFEHICQSMRVVIMTILEKQGLQNQRVLQILMADQNAEPLRSLLLSLLSETHELSSTDQQVITHIMNRVQELTSTRNEVLHGTWYIGVIAEDGSAVAPGIKYKKNKNGVNTKTFQWTVSDFNEIAKEAQTLWRLLAMVSKCLSCNAKLDNNFAFSASGELHGTFGFDAPRV